MEWISVKDRMPTKYERHYLILMVSKCDLCDNSYEEHSHKLNFVRFRYDIGVWSEKDLRLIEYYHAKNDHSWDFCMYDSFSEHNLPEVTHWMEFPLFDE